MVVLRAAGVGVDGERCCLVHSQGRPAAVLLLSPRLATVTPQNLGARKTPDILYNASMTWAGGAGMYRQSQANPGSLPPQHWHLGAPHASFCANTKWPPTSAAIEGLRAWTGAWRWHLPSCLWLGAQLPAWRWCGSRRHSSGAGGKRRRREEGGWRGLWRGVSGCSRVCPHRGACVGCVMRSLTFSPIACRMPGSRDLRGSPGTPQASTGRGREKPTPKPSTPAPKYRGICASQPADLASPTSPGPAQQGLAPLRPPARSWGVRLSSPPLPLCFFPSLLEK